MAKALGIGGIFFKASDPERLAAWYGETLGMEIDPSFGGACLHPAELPPAAYAVWSPFEARTRYFEPSAKDYMINLIVDDVRGALSQVSAGGGTVVGEPQELEYGLFGWFMDPEGNKIELWQPAVKRRQESVKGGDGSR